MVRSEVSKRSVPDVQDPNCLARFIHPVEDAIDVFTFTEKKASDFPLRFSRFPSEGTPKRQGFEQYRQSTSYSNHSGPLIGARSTTQS